MPRTPSRSGHVRGRPDYEALPEHRRDAHDRAMAALRYMRSEGLALTAAAEIAGTTPRTVRRYAAPALERQGNRWRPTSGDRLYRRMAVFGATGRADVDVRGSRVASLVGSHFNAVDRYLRTGDASVLAPFRGKRVGGVELLTDVEIIERLDAAHELDIDDIYPRT